MTTAPRLTSRALGLLALALAAVTCSEGPTAPRRSDAARQARIALAPSFSAGAARSYEALTQLGFEIASARVRLTAADGRVAADTVVPFPATQDTLKLDLSVLVSGGEETFTALIELRDASGLVLFSGTRLVTARAMAVPSAAPAPFVMEYAGPGRDARALALTPATGAVSAVGMVPLTATAVDAAGRPVADLLVRWTTSDSALGRLTPVGAASAELQGAGKRGAITVVAITPTGLSASVTLGLVPPPARLVVVDGDGQTAVAGRTLAEPLVVQVEAADGGPAPGATVRFRAVTSGGSVATTSVVTDAAGRASTEASVGRRAGEYAFEASSGALAPVTIVAGATPAPPAAIARVSGSGQRVTVGTAIEAPLVALVTDDQGEPAEGATVTWSVVVGSGRLSAARSITDADGRAAISYTVGSYAGAERILASLSGVNGASVEFETHGEPADPAKLRVLQALPSSIQIGVPPSTSLRVQLVDEAGNAVSQSGVVVTATGVVTPGNRAPFVVAAASDGAGIVTFPLPAYVGALGNATITLTSPGLAALTLPPIAFVTGPATKLRIATQPSAAAWSGAVLPVQPAVQLSDAGGNDVTIAGTSVTAFIASGGGTLSGTTTVVTDANGVATFGDLAITGAPGQRTIGFSSQSLADEISDAIDVAAPLIESSPLRGSSPR